jgi:hypothetical protein
MSVWKKINKQDAFVTTYVAKKRWTLSGEDLEGYGVRLLPAYSTFTPDPTPPPPPLECEVNFIGYPLGNTCLFVAEGEALSGCDFILGAEYI